MSVDEPGETSGVGVVEEGLVELLILPVDLNPFSTGGVTSSLLVWR